MSSKKRVRHGFNGYQFPVIPKAPRSVRRKHSHKDIADDQICAFELLAAVAGELLQESESSACSNAAVGKDELSDCREVVKREQLKEDKAMKSECFDQGSCVESAYIPEPAVQEQNLKYSLDKPNRIENNIFQKNSCTFLNCDFSKKDCKEVNINGKFDTEVEGGSCSLEDVCDKRIETGTKKQLDDDGMKTEDLTVANSCSVKGPIEKHVNNKSAINSDSSVQFPCYRAVPRPSFGKQGNNVKLGTRDDDENSFRSYRHSTNIRAFTQTSRLGYRRMRKMLTSRHWKVAPQLKDWERSCSNYGMKSFHRNRKRVRALERCRLEIPSKRRKLCHNSSVVSYDQQANSKSISKSREKGIKKDIISPRGPGAGASASFRNHHKKDSNVKFSIKSFKVPELLIEVPENETIGSLKRTVMEAVKTILGSGLRVGMVVQGKKVRDDNKTLHQAGISQNGNLETLGFTLEPSSYPVSPSLHSKDLPASSPYVAEHELTRRPPSPIMELELPSASSDPPKTRLDEHDEDYHELALSPTNPIVDSPSDASNHDSRALVIVSPPNGEAHPVVPVSPKNSRSELPQRRTRRPFSVAEVEELVEAVEQLGTGRWRDVKIRAFEYADHRTYVDVKDKWKTLVHTASIAPQQRRGEPVPQELLDRVLVAHGYWSKQHGKHHAENIDAIENNNNNSASMPSKITGSTI